MVRAYCPYETECNLHANLESENKCHFICSGNSKCGLFIMEQKPNNTNKNFNEIKMLTHPLKWKSGG